MENPHDAHRYDDRNGPTGQEHWEPMTDHMCVYDDQGICVECGAKQKWHFRLEYLERHGRQRWHVSHKTYDTSEEAEKKGRGYLAMQRNEGKVGTREEVKVDSVTYVKEKTQDSLF